MMHLKDHSNEKLETKRKGYAMRNLFVIVVAVLLLIAVVAPVQAAELPSTEDHTWGGDPDEDVSVEGWVSWWWFVMKILYFYHLDVI